MTDLDTTPDPLRVLARRHARLGLFALLFFLTLGVLLEAFHGFKIGFYLDVNNEARRLTLRLAHAHGTLLGIVHLVFALLLCSPLAPPEKACRRASACLSAALLLLPGGFLLGGLFVHGGDPGPGVFLVPVGAAFLFAGVAILWRGVPK
ncbi:MAG TPA: hypothetical protein VGP93_07600 [Polyangiaceae bacterium]|jgi:hypothetical protein|nr:hypothetical protein [Polyangiaceae bacterium]